MSYGRLRFFDRLRRTKTYVPGMHKTLPKRLNWEQIESRPEKERKHVVKGTSKRIVVVKSPDPNVFEEAIFIVREDFLGRAHRPDALKEAQKVADAYIRGAVAAPRRLLTRFAPVLWAAIGAALSATAVILLTHI